MGVPHGSRTGGFACRRSWSGLRSISSCRAQNLTISRAVGTNHTPQRVTLVTAKERSLPTAEARSVVLLVRLNFLTAAAVARPGRSTTLPGKRLSRSSLSIRISGRGRSRIHEAHCERAREYKCHNAHESLLRCYPLLTHLMIRVGSRKWQTLMCNY